MALHQVDQDLLRALIADDPQAWPAFVDRFLGLVSHVVAHAADCRGVRLTAPDREDLVAEVFKSLLEREKAVLRRFQGRSSLATYLTVVARRVVVRRLMSRAGLAPAPHFAAPPLAAGGAVDEIPSRERAPAEVVANRDQVTHLLGSLPDPDAQVVRMYHLEGRSYHEISRAVGLPENSIGPLLSRARQRMSQLGG